MSIATSEMKYKPMGLTGLVQPSKTLPKPVRIGYEPKGIAAQTTEEERQRVASIRTSLASGMPTGPVIGAEKKKKRILGLPPVVVFVAGAAVVAFAIYKIAKA